MRTIGVCQKCNIKGYIANKKEGLCFRCNSRRLHTEKANINKKKGNRNEVAIYREIWAERPHICNLTFRNLDGFFGTPFWYSCFAHILSKGKYPQLKYNKDNILLVHPDVHYDMDFGTKDMLIRKIGQGQYDKLIEKKEQLKKSLDEE